MRVEPVPAAPTAKKSRRKRLLRSPEEIDLEHKPKNKFDTVFFLTALTQVVTALCCLGVVAFFAYHLMLSLTDEVETVAVRKTTETGYVGAEAWILRREVPVESRMRGVRVYYVTDGEKIQSGKDLCAVYPAGTAGTAARLEELDAEIALLRRCVTGGTVSFGIPSAQTMAEAELGTITEALRAGDLSGAMEGAEELRAALGRLAVLTGEGGGLEQRLAGLTAERNRLTEELGQPTGTVTAETGGYFFAECDGYEAAFSALLDGNLNLTTLREAAASAPDDVSAAVGKLADGQKWYLAVPVSDPALTGTEQGSVLRVTFPDDGGLVLEMTVERRVLPENEGDGILLLLSSDRHPEGFSYLRTQKVLIETGSVTGLRIPLRALHSYDGETGVYVVNGGVVLFRRVKILYEGDGYYLVAAGSGTRASPYYVLSYDTGLFPDRITGMCRMAYERGWMRRDPNTGGKAVRYGHPYAYYYWLDEFESVVVGGDDLYHGKVLK